MTSSQEESTLISPFFSNRYRYFFIYIFMIALIVHIAQERNFVKYPKRIANSERDFASSTVNLFPWPLTKGSLLIVTMTVVATN